MAGTFLCPRACRFVKVATIEIARKARSEARKRGDETASHSTGFPMILSVILGEIIFCTQSHEVVSNSRVARFI